MFDNFYTPHKTTNIKKNVKAIINEFNNIEADTAESELTKIGKFILITFIINIKF